ncbi:uncharacterized protein N7477_005953 [Penicillium maclennaniae]|uniref:uncharacterized protein n=1 Tax=Penicillium maclennaniae TaxID=1343394 RepID=UPI002540CB0D|nr:uncharacterized protein N7477_005953 [Penicillium maclennaniae]KAJ5670590.1 hypothetical protein N7477_005953 [Penicillium maclennaniae]
MFYSHEILTSPEHGVATIWLVATLGSRSIARRINRRAIQDVDVPSACRVIIDPRAPMALRLQGSLLYGVSRVFNQQCGYTLLDAQTMHDKMMAMLKIAPGAALDSSAGKSNGSQNGQVQLEFPHDELVGGNLLDKMNDINSSAQKQGLFGKQMKPSMEEEGVLLNPDFEFDDNGDIVEFDASRVSPTEEGRQVPVTANDDEAGLVRKDNVMDLGDQIGAEVTLSGEENLAETVGLDESMNHERRVNQRRREAKVIVTDVVTALRNTDLARWNNEYTANMAQALKQKQLNKLPTIAKKNAAHWVFGKGIGAVGNPLWPLHVPHPLKSYSGEELYYALCPEAERKRRRTKDTGNDSDAREQGRRVRPRDEQVDSMDVEVARHAPSSVLDDLPLMPWNTITSIESSQRGQRFRSGSELSYGSRRRGQLQSASPLAGRGYLHNLDRDSSLDIPGNFGNIDDIDYGERRIAKPLDPGTLNFWDFLKDKMLPSRGGRIKFEALFPPQETSHPVATQAFMNVLTLATQGVIRVGQEPFQDQESSSKWSTRCEYGNIWLRLPQLK